MTELKPCPFCGGEAKMLCLLSVNNSKEISKIFQIVCNHCNTKQDTFKMSASILNDGTCEFDNSEANQAVERWNRRANDVMPVVRGRWAKNDDKAGWHCSVCQKENLYAYCWNPDTDITYTLQDKFCPNCGADMRGEQNNEQ